MRFLKGNEIKELIKKENLVIKPFVSEEYNTATWNGITYHNLPPYGLGEIGYSFRLSPQRSSIEYPAKETPLAGSAKWERVAIEDLNLSEPFIHIPSFGQLSGYSEEEFHIPPHIGALVCLSPRYIGRGLIMNSYFITGGWSGYIPFSIFNPTDSFVEINLCGGIGKIFFIDLS